MQPGQSVSRSPLDKPLHLLTEDDISQLTREDCRKYLKEKGMRRPSWNKSQAIQQVISLKTLLETTPDSDPNEAPKRLYIPPRPNNPLPHPPPANASVSVTGTSDQIRISVSAEEESVSYRRRGLPKPHFPGDPSPVGLAVPTENDSVSPRATGAADDPAGQMTIFYCGKVNVYDDVPIDKAQTIMKLAASPLPSPQDTSSHGIQALSPLPCQLEILSVKTTSGSPMLIFPTLQTEKVPENCQLRREENTTSCEDNLEGPTSRKASVQRYLEKRKDRFKNKRKVALPSCASLDIYLNRHVGDQMSNDQWNIIDACSPLQPRPSQMLTRCSSIEKMAKAASCSADLNDKDALEC